jgi:homoserine O-acetyltransferase
MQALEWALLDPRVEAVAALATSGRHSAWCIAISEAQRAALRADPYFRDGRYPPQRPPRAGLAAARQIAMVSYRSRAGLEARFGREEERGRFAVADWLSHHGEALVARFDANSYLALTRAMDTHDLARGRGRYADVLRSLHQPTLLLSIDSDVLYPPAEQEELARLLPDARLVRLDSPHGHDAFLIEAAAVDAALLEFREELRTRPAARVAS